MSPDVIYGVTVPIVSSIVVSTATIYAAMWTGAEKVKKALDVHVAEDKAFQTRVEGYLTPKFA